MPLNRSSAFRRGHSRALRRPRPASPASWICPPAPTSSAILTGTAALRSGFDLRVNRYLPLVIDSRKAVEIECAGDRPRATLRDEVVKKINTASPGNPASTDGKHLVLTSPSSGGVSRVV